MSWSAWFALRAFERLASASRRHYFARPVGFGTGAEKHLRGLAIRSRFAHTHGRELTECVLEQARLRRGYDDERRHDYFATRGARRTRLTVSKCPAGKFKLVAPGATQVGIVFVRPDRIHPAPADSIPHSER